jgi:hypothetical protein
MASLATLYLLEIHAALHYSGLNYINHSYLSGVQLHVSTHDPPQSDGRTEDCKWHFGGHSLPHKHKLGTIVGIAIHMCSISHATNMPLLRPEHFPQCCYYKHV